MEITGSLNAYLSPYSSISPDDLSDPSAIASLSFTSGVSEYFAQHGYTLVGTAAITVTIMGKDEIISNKIDALRSEAATIRANATAKCTRIEGQIQQLLCIENSAAPVD
jgi:hypothetical protein